MRGIRLVEFCDFLGRFNERGRNLGKSYEQGATNKGRTKKTYLVTDFIFEDVTQLDAVIEQQGDQ